MVVMVTYINKIFMKARKTTIDWWCCQE